MRTDSAGRWAGVRLKKTAVAGMLLLAACGGGTPHADPAFARIQTAAHGAPPGTLGVQVQWTLDLAPKFGGRYIPVERASVASDASGELFVGSTHGVVWRLDRDGQALWQRDLHAGIEAAPATESGADTVWVAAIDGQVHALEKKDGAERWRTRIGGAVSSPIRLTADALYLVTDDDKIFALNRATGEVLWRFAHDASASSLAIAGHAGLLLEGGRLYTGFSDGTVVALDISDGRRLWQVDTSLDVDMTADGTAFVDVDTTPLRIGDKLFVASFAAGLYELAADSGLLLARYPQFTGVIGLTGDHDALLLSSSEQGLVCVDLVSMAPRWTRPAARLRGAPTQPQLRSGRVFVGESRGALLVLALDDGHELARLESGYGYTATPLIEPHRGVALSNAARLLAFMY